jgi:BMFP domain-containing protein YqiC
MEVAAVDEQGRSDELEARISELERHQTGSGARRESMETAFWALMREVFPAQTRTHMRAAGREQLLAARSYLDHWIAKLDEKAPAAAPPEREEITVE